MNQPDFNIVSNQGYAQIVHHVSPVPPSSARKLKSNFQQVHFHLVPAPIQDSPTRSGWASLLGRDELDEEEALIIVEKIKTELKKEADAERQSKL